MTEEWEKAPVVGGGDWVNAPIVRQPSPGSALAKGVNVGLANTLGAPVDLANAGLGLVGAGSERPVGGSKQIRDIFGQFGMGYENREDLMPAEQLAARAGEVIGESAPLAAVPLAATRGTVQAGKSMAEPILNMARSQPGRFAATEAGGIGGAALGSAVAPQILSGEELSQVSGGLFSPEASEDFIRQSGEVIGGTFSPPALLTRATLNAWKNAGHLIQRWTPAGRRKEVGREVAKTMEGFGEDVPSTIRRLRGQQEVPGTALTSGQKSGSPTLMGYEARLLKDVPNLSNDVRQKAVQTAQALDAAFKDAVAGGDAALISQLGQERAQLYQSFLDARVQSAEQRAAQTLERMGPGRTQGDASVQARNTLQSALTDARARETQLWEDIPRDIELDAGPVLDSYDTGRLRLLKSETLPQPVEAEIARIRENGANSGDLLRLRSRLLSLSSDMKAGQNPDNTKAGILGETADGILDAFQDIPEATPAREFSRVLNDRFSRGTVGNILRRGGNRGVRVPPEMTLERAIGQGGTQGSLASRELEEAAGLQGMTGDMTRRTTLPEQADFIRSALEETFNRSTGRVNPEALQRWVRKNSDLLGRFPSIAAELQDATTAQQFLRRMEQYRTRAQKVAAQDKVFSKFAGTENPSRLVGSALSSEAPVKNYRRLVQTARRGGDAGIAGLRRATFDHLFEQATTNGKLSGQRMLDALNARPSSAHKPFSQQMIDSGVITRDQADALTRIADEAIRLEDLSKQGVDMAEVLSDVGPLEDLMVRLVGANVGSAGAVGQMTGAPLVAAQAGSRASRTLAEKIPMSRTRDVLVQAIEDPQFMANLLESADTPTAQRKQARALNAYLLQLLIGEEE